MSNITKRALSASLKKLLAHSSLDDITIQMLVDDTQVSRKTFYYHFHDIYDLCEWSLNEDIHIIIGGQINLTTWPQQIRNVIDYLSDNRMLILNAFRCLDHDTLEGLLFSTFKPLVETMLRDEASFSVLNEEDQHFLTDVYAFGLVGVLLRWISDGMLAPPDSLIDRFIRLFSGSLVDSISRFRNASSPMCEG